MLLLCACFQRVTEIRTVDTDQGVVFEVQEIDDGLTEGQSYQLLDLTVMQQDCEKDCTMWFIVRNASLADGGILDTGRIVYGEAPAGMSLRTQARALAPGGYTVSATIQEYGAEGELTRSLSLDGDFSIYRDGSGRERVRGNP